jgi:hypothetical protein
MEVELSPENAAVVADQSKATGRTFDQTVNDIIQLYGVARGMAPIIPPPLWSGQDLGQGRNGWDEEIDAWEPPDIEWGSSPT